MSSSSKKSPNLIQKTPGSQPCFRVVKAYEKIVLLYDWWLIEVESNSKGRRLGVAGFPSRGRQAIREFKSTEIIKRHDAVTLETKDGITVTITNGMNMFRTLQNGFPPEVCNHFLSGFPYNWKEFAADKCVGQDFTKKTGPSRTFNVNGVGTSLDDLPVAHVRDFLLHSSGDTARCLIEKCISNLIPRNQGGNIFEDNMNFAKTGSKRRRQEDISCSSRVVISDLSENANPKTQNASKFVKSKDKGDALCSTDPKQATACEEDDTIDKNQLKSGDLSDDAILKAQSASTVEEKSKEDDNNEKSRLLAGGDFSGDATLKTQNTSKDEEKCEDESGSVCLTDTKKENTPKAKTMRGRSIDQISSRRVTTRSMTRLNNSKSQRIVSHEGLE